MVKKLVLGYPHFQPSLEPKRLKAEAIWVIGELARQQICGPSPRPRVDVAQIIRRSRHMEVNGIVFEVHWELGHPVADELGQPVAGAVEYDESFPLAAMISLNSELLEGRDDLTRSTAAHELGHAIFDTPAWIQQATRPGGTIDNTPMRYFQGHTEGAAPGQRSTIIDWREWRANEFMGAFLAPRRLLHRLLHKRAAALRVPLTEAASRDDLPIIHAGKASFEAIETLAIELAEILGVSIEFIEVRLRKYGLIGCS